MKKLVFAPVLAVVSALIFWGCPSDLNDLNDVSSIENIIGTWAVLRDEGGIQSTYQVEISKSSKSDSAIVISNFFNNGNSAYAYVKELEITMPLQDVGDNKIKGTATISSDFQRIVWNLDVDGDNVTLTMTPGSVAKKLPIAR